MISQTSIIHPTIDAETYISFIAMLLAYQNKVYTESKSNNQEPLSSSRTTTKSKSLNFVIDKVEERAMFVNCLI